MKTLWLSSVCCALCIIAVWCSRTTYGQPPRAPEGPRMVAIDDAILDAREILFVDETQTDIRIAFRGLPNQGNGGFSVLFVKKTAENWRALAAATGVAVPPRATAGP